MAAASIVVSGCSRKSTEEAPSTGSVTGRPVEGERAGAGAPASPGTEIFRGIFSEPFPGRARLRPCHRNLLLSLRDETGGTLPQLRAELAPAATDDLFVELGVEREAPEGGSRAPQDAVIVVREVLRAQRVGAANPCAAILAAGQTRVVGGDPAWSLTLSADEITWVEHPAAAPLEFPAAEPTLSGRGRGTRTWATTRTGEPRTRLRVVVTPSPCRDAAGAWYATSAEISLDGRTFQGCAYDGEPVPAGRR